MDPGSARTLPPAVRQDLEPPRLPTGRLTADGPRLLDALGRQVLLRGANAGGRSKLPPFLPFELEGDETLSPTLDRFMDQLASWGLNVLRLPFSWEALEPERGRFDDRWLGRYTALVDAAWARGMRAVVDFHQDVFAAPFSGDGFPRWAVPKEHRDRPREDTADGHWFLQYLTPGSPVNAAFDRFWANEDGLLDAFLAMWRHMAGHLADHPGVAGFEVVNEPGWGSCPQPRFEAEVLPGVVARVGRAVRSLAPGVLVVCGGPGTGALTGTSWAEHPGIPGYVFAPHTYQASVIVGGPLADEGAVAAGVRSLAGAGERMGCPVLFGELGAAHHSPDARRFLRAAYAALDAVHAHATVWEVSWSDELWNEENLSLTEADGRERDLVEEVVRPYPRAVAGTLRAFSWDPEARVFTLEVDDAGEAVSEVWLPTRHLGRDPWLGLDGGVLDWDPDRGVVRVRGTEGEGWRLGAAAR